MGDGRSVYILICFGYSVIESTATSAELAGKLLYMRPSRVEFDRILPRLSTLAQTTSTTFPHDCSIYPCQVWRFFVPSTAL